MPSLTHQLSAALPSAVHAQSSPQTPIEAGTLRPPVAALLSASHQLSSLPPCQVEARDLLSRAARALASFRRSPSIHLPTQRPARPRLAVPAASEPAHLSLLASRCPVPWGSESVKEQTLISNLATLRHRRVQRP